jgi:hypothetical protein
MTTTATPAGSRRNLAAAPSRTCSGSGQGSGGRNQRAAQRAVDATSTTLDLSLGSAEVHLTLPPLDKMAFYAGLVGAAAFGLIEWPIAVLAGVGHLLSDDRRNRALRALGEALDAV